MAKRATKPGLVFIAVKVQPQLKSFLQERANKKLVSISDVVREAILLLKEREHGNV